MKKYTNPTTAAVEVNGREMLALSIVEGGTADDSEVLADKKGWSSDSWSDADGYWNEGAGDSED